MNKQKENTSFLLFYHLKILNSIQKQKFLLRSN